MPVGIELIQALPHLIKPALGVLQILGACLLIIIVTFFDRTNMKIVATYFPGGL
jgi:hypothetical protein